MKLDSLAQQYHKDSGFFPSLCPFLCYGGFIKSWLLLLSPQMTDRALGILLCPTGRTWCLCPSNPRKIPRVTLIGLDWVTCLALDQSLLLQDRGHGWVHFPGTTWIPVELWGLMEGTVDTGRHPVMGRHQRNANPAFTCTQPLTLGQ